MGCSARRVTGVTARNSADLRVAPGQGPVDDVVINEVLTHTDLPQVDRIELYNTTNQTIDIGRWFISDNNDNYFEYQFPAIGTTIPARGYRSLTENELGFGFRGQSSDDAWLISADAAGRPLRFIDHAEFGAAQNGISLGRWPNGTGRLFPMVATSFGSSNRGPLLGNVVIGEVQYHSEPPPQGSTITQNELDFVEIVNNGPSTVGISHWRLNKAIDYAFPAGTSIAPTGRLAVVSFDPAAEPTKAAEFRSIYSVSPGTPLFGPYTGLLDNGGENLELDRPEDLLQLGLGLRSG